MILTVMTIVFLPLSFMSSVFGMNAAEFGSDNSWPIRDEFKFMCKLQTCKLNSERRQNADNSLKVPIAFGIMSLTFLFAFGDWIRAAVWYLYKIACTRGIVHLGLYDMWLAFNRPSKKLHQLATEQTNKLKSGVRAKRSESRRGRN